MEAPQANSPLGVHSLLLCNKSKHMVHPCGQCMYQLIPTCYIHCRHKFILIHAVHSNAASDGLALLSDPYQLLGLYEDSVSFF